MPKYIELGAEEVIKTSEIFGKIPVMRVEPVTKENKDKEDKNNGCDKDLRQHDAH